LNNKNISNPAASLFVKVPDSKLGEEIIARPSVSYWQDAWSRLRRNKIAVFAGVYICFLSLAAGFVPEMIQYSYEEQEIWNAHQTPTFSGQEALVVGSNPIDFQPKIIQIKRGSDENGSYLTDPPTSAPAGLKVIGTPLTVGAVISWEKLEGIDGYRIYRSRAADTLGIPLDDLGAEQLNYLDTSSLQGGQEYYYFVTAFNAFGDGPASEPAKVEPLLALKLEDALKIDFGAKIGATITTNPHYFGTDYLGRDLLSRIMVGARISLFIGFGAPLIYVLIGIVYGSIAGYFGGFVDDAMMRITDIVATVPELLVVILLQVVMGSGVTTLLIALVAVAWARSARQVRGEVLRLREMEFVQAAIVLGTPFRKIVFRHLLPNVMNTILVVLTLAVPSAIFTEAFLSFIGLGISPPMASWGTVTKDGAKVFLTYPHELVIPSIMICFTMLAFNLFGDGLRDALDPKLRGVS
jgi:oligopeptide transport system permease protein